MLVRKSPLDLRIVLVHELRKHFPSCSASVLSEAGPDRVALQQPYEPGVQAIVVQLLHQLSFLPNALERCTAITPRIEGHPSFEWSLQKLRFSSTSTSQTSARIFLSG